VSEIEPYRRFQLDFDAMLLEGKRQEQISALNRGEHVLVKNMHAYFVNDVLPLTRTSDWVFEAAAMFGSHYAQDCFRLLRLYGQQAYDFQKRLAEINAKVIDLLARASMAGAAPTAGIVDLAKASDSLGMLDFSPLPPAMQAEAGSLHETATDHEFLQLEVTLDGIRACYEIWLPRVMYVVRRAVKVRCGMPPRPMDDKLIGTSQLVTWYKKHFLSPHALHPVLGELDSFYKVARNVASHHRGLRWIPQHNQVVLEDQKTVLTMPVHQFQQKYRHILYLCELGLRGILWAFCERERGPLSEALDRDYRKTFPEGFAEGAAGLSSQ
jgi:hypothetical protein